MSAAGRRPILVTGAAGKTGLAVIRALARRELPVRAMVHVPGRDGKVRRAGATEVAVADFGAEDALASAFAGSRAVYHICPNMSGEEAAIGRRVIAACRAAGVERLVYHSVLHPQLEAMPHHWAKLRVEEAVIESGLEWTILQPAAYMQNLLAGWSSIVDRGRYRIPYAAETRIGMVDLDDVAEAAARVLEEDGHEGAIYELAGSAVLSQGEVAASLSRALRRRVEVEVVPRERWRDEALAAGLPAPAVETLEAMFGHYERHGFLGNARVLTHLLGRPPARLEEFLRRVADGPG